MAKRTGKPPKPPLERLPVWHERILDSYFKGLPGLYFRVLLDKAAAAERSEHATDSARRKHEKDNALKEKAREHYLSNKAKYRNNMDAAGELCETFPKFAFRTYLNLVSKWSKE